MQESSASVTTTADHADRDLIGTATYSPEDNKLRIYPFARLDADVYARVRAAGFIWAPKQDLFVAPMWTPDRADLAVELCGELGDEDQSLVERAEERAERFEDYKDSRTRDAQHAQAAVSAIADNIPFGQPILIGHHSERRARKDAERIENGMRRAIRMWDTADYWKARAAGAIRHAKYKERPDVRARRIKGIEADRRKQIAHKTRAAELVRLLALVDQPEKWKAREDGSIPTREERGYILAGKMSGGPYCANVRTDGPNATTLHYSAYGPQAQSQRCPKRRKPNRWRVHFRRALHAAMYRGKGYDPKPAHLGTAAYYLSEIAWARTEVKITPELRDQDHPRFGQYWKYHRVARRYRRAIRELWKLPGNLSTMREPAPSRGLDATWTRQRNALLTEARQQQARQIRRGGCTYTFWADAKGIDGRPLFVEEQTAS